MNLFNSIYVTAADRSHHDGLRRAAGYALVHISHSAQVSC